MKPFVCVPTPKLYYGQGIFQSLPSILIEKKFTDIVLITGKSSLLKTAQWQKFTRELDHLGIHYLHFTASGENDPESIDTIVDSLKGEKIDAVIAAGGGTVLDAGKAVSALLCMEGSIVDFLEGVGKKVPTGEENLFSVYRLHQVQVRKPLRMR